MGLGPVFEGIAIGAPSSDQIEGLSPVILESVDVSLDSLDFSQFSED